MTTAYALTVDLQPPLPAAIESLRAALAAEQTGIVSEVEVQATLKAKLGLDSPPQKLLRTCSPCEMATAALQRVVARLANGTEGPAAAAAGGR